MMNRTFTTMMTTAAVLGAMMAGCSGGGQDRPRLTVSDAQSTSPRVERMLAEKDYAQALVAAEQLVGANPHDANARALLGRAYLANGRYVSARIAFGDAMTLGNRDPRTIVSLALSESGLGGLEAARALLTDHIADLPAADYGLAMTLAGDPREGVRALLEAVHAPDATAKTRQNLAYALAMAGSLGQARLIAGQDLPAREAEARIGEWTRSLAQGGASDRVVAMLGVSPRPDDSGLPAQLALNATPQQPVQLASASDLIEDAAAHADAGPAAPVTQEAPVERVEAVSAEQAAFAPGALAAVLTQKPGTHLDFAAAEPVGSAPGGSFAPVPALQQGDAGKAVLAAAFTTVEPAAPAIKPVVPLTSQQTLKQAFVQSKSTAGANFAAAIGKPVPAGRASDWVVQLGAFDSDALARSQWSKLSNARETLKVYSAVHSTVQVNGRTFYRLAIRGFEDRGAAATACGALKNSGQDCFVRLDDNSNGQAGYRPSGRTSSAR